MKRALCALGLVSSTVLHGACRGDGDLPANDVCQETASSLAAQALACSGDIKTSNAQYALFNEQYQCQPLTQDNAYACAGSLPGAPCNTVLASGSLETLFKRVAPVCTQVLINNPNFAQPVLPWGTAHAQGTFNNAMASFDCTFPAATVTSDNPAAGPSSVLANVTCGGGTFGFDLALVGTGVPQISQLVFTDFTGTNDATPTSTMTFSTSSIDPFGYFHGTGVFTFTGQGTQLNYNLQGTVDLVLQPPQ